MLAKNVPGERKPTSKLDPAIRKSSRKRWSGRDEVVASFAAGRHEKARHLILSDEVSGGNPRAMPLRNLAVELLQKLLKGARSVALAAQLVTGTLVFRNAEMSLRRYQESPVIETGKKLVRSDPACQGSCGRRATRRGTD